ncbi:MAG: hypothetical protein IKN65_06815 [Clostridia bacterium]|nr:hypothetical protein [Clostridia bacterium]
MGDNGLSAADVALLNRNNGWDGDGMGGFMWIFALLILAGGGFGGFNNAIGYENLATSNEVQRGFDNQNLQAQTRDILAAVNSGTAQAVAATNQTFHDNLAAMQNLYNETSRDIANLALGQANLAASQAQCCCETKQMIMQNNYDGALRDAATNANLTAQIQSVKDMIAQDKIEALQNRINQLELQNATAGIVRYPNSWTYNAGANPFCGCGCGTM